MRIGENFHNELSAAGLLHVAFSFSPETGECIFCDTVPQAERDAVLAVIAAHDPTKRDYRIARAENYPPFQEFIDAQVKKSSPDPAVQQAGIAQESIYLAQCLAVKANYPKG